MENDEDGCQEVLKGERLKEARQLDSLHDTEEQAEKAEAVDESRSAALLSSLREAAKESDESNAAMVRVKVNVADVQALSALLRMEKAHAEQLLKKHNGSLENTLVSSINSLPAFN